MTQKSWPKVPMTEIFIHKKKYLYQNNWDGILYFYFWSGCVPKFSFKFVGKIAKFKIADPMEDRKF